MCSERKTASDDLDSNVAAHEVFHSALYGVRVETADEEMIYIYLATEAGSFKCRVNAFLLMFWQIVTD